MKKVMLALLLALPFVVFSQNSTKKTMGPEVWDLWKRIEQQQISNDGNWVAFTLTNEEQNPEVELFNSITNRTFFFPRAQKPKFSEDNKYLFFEILPDRDSVLELRRVKTKEDKLPHPSLGILNLETQELERIPRLMNFKSPKYWSGTIAMKQEVDPKSKKDTTLEHKPKPKLLIKDLDSGQTTEIEYIDKFDFSKRTPGLLLSVLEKDSIDIAGVYHFDCRTQKLENLKSANGEYEHLELSPDGTKYAFLLNQDTTKSRIKPFDLFYGEISKGGPEMILSADTEFGDLRINEKGKLNFNDGSSRLFFGLGEVPLLQDTSLLKEEIVNVEVWTSLDKRTYPQQKIQLEIDKGKSYDWLYDVESKEFLQIGGETISEVIFDRDRDHTFCLAFDDSPGLQASSWEGFPIRKNVHAVDLRSGEAHQFISNLATSPSLSPAGIYAYWYDRGQDAWYTYDLQKKEKTRLAGKEVTEFNNELHDSPIDAYAYGRAGWTQNDERLLVYDRYDIWSLDPTGQERPKRLTKGRKNAKIHRMVRLDREDPFFYTDKKWLIRQVNENTKSESYHHLTFGEKISDPLIAGSFQLTSRPLKARDANAILFTKQSFKMFPDLHLALEDDFSGAKRVSEANPQQKEYSWGDIELASWKDYAGNEVRGLLVKPEDFDPSKKYPLLVNFYEKSSSGLHRHRAPYPHRSSINYTYYANQGYVVFNPDVAYTTGAPGESAYRAVMSGVDHMIKEGYIDEDKMALQGHSWGGYQVAYLLTRTDRFVCAESGAPVVNMTSAYGGIRWWTGLSRMFQYEKTQSRLGKTLWEDPKAYLNNSPLFDLDKMKTPVLIMHNDADGHVPWYQGIEYFMALRRLGKKAWFLNYPGEPHWPVKRQNREDFQTRMNQFFDHYLMDKAKPMWMVEGVPPLEMGIEQGLELSEQN
ncbi:MAG: S9 family peptidase [Saprospiraceae bacterium]|nr:S9 family peptidase [Saprospiraceae bacterium]